MPLPFKMAKLNRRGMSLLGVLVAASLTGLVAIAIGQLMKGAVRGMASVELRGEMLDVRQLARTRLNCKKTFPASSCPAANPIVLKDMYDRPIFTDVETTPGPFENTWKYNNARVQTSCVAGKLELRFVSVREPKKAWPTTPHLEVCHNVLGGTVGGMCPASEVMVGIDQETLAPICAAPPPPPPPPPAPTPGASPKFASGTLARASGANTTNNPAVPQAHLVAVNFTPQHAICASTQDSYTNSWLSCQCSVSSMIPGSVTFTTSLGNGNHLHPVGCSFRYLIVGE